MDGSLEDIMNVLLRGQDFEAEISYEQSRPVNEVVEGVPLYELWLV